jgi:hypothetical protein
MGGGSFGSAIEAVASMLGFIAATGRQRKRNVHPRHVLRISRQIPDLLDYQMRDAARVLHFTVTAEHGRAEDRSAVLLKDSGPYNQIGVSGFIFERDEHDAFGRARHLPDQNEPRNREPTAVSGGSKRCAGLITVDGFAAGVVRIYGDNNPFLGIAAGPFLQGSEMYQFESRTSPSKTVDTLTAGGYAEVGFNGPEDQAETYFRVRGGQQFRSSGIGSETFVGEWMPVCKFVNGGSPSLTTIFRRAFVGDAPRHIRAAHSTSFSNIWAKVGLLP